MQSDDREATGRLQGFVPGYNLGSFISLLLVSWFQCSIRVVVELVGVGREVF